MMTETQIDLPVEEVKALLGLLDDESLGELIRDLHKRGVLRDEHLVSL